MLLGCLLGSCNREEKPEETEPVGSTGETEDTTPVSLFKPQHTADTDPANWGIRWEIFSDGKLTHSYLRQDAITFGDPDAYFALPGVATFRGNNYRDNAAYGTADIAEKTISLQWTAASTDLPGGKRLLPQLLKELCAIEDLHWVRLHYVYPDEIDEELIEVIASEPKIVKYLDIPIQHCNSQILERMNRRGNGEYLRWLLKTLREKIPGLVLRSSIITGLPGEGEEEFRELCEFLKDMRMERVGAFPFSPQEGSEAAKMEYPDYEIAQERAQIIEELQSRIMDDWNDSMVGKDLEVLVDGYDEELGQFYGRSYADSPDVDGRVWIATDEPLREGNFVMVHIDGSAEGELTGYVID